MNEVADIVLFFGRFHPLVVHLPIGFLFFAFVLEGYSRWKKDLLITSAIPIALFFGALSALVACILGYMLSLSGEYEEDALDTHFWFGIATTTVASLAWLIRSGRIKVLSLNGLKPNIAALTLIVVLISITGHYGGNLTHGSDYLVKYLPFGDKEENTLVAVTNVEEAVVFDHLVNPMLQNKCASCHNSSKKKGGLSFQDTNAILKGGKNGPVFVAGDASKSEMIRRVVMDSHHEDFMPPEGKTPLTEEEIAILTYWIETGNGSFDATLASLEAPENVQDIAAGMLGLDASAQRDAALASVPAVSATILNDLQVSGFEIRELVFESNLMDVALLPNKGLDATKITAMLKQLSKIGQNIIWLSLPANGIKDEHAEIISTFQNLKKLRLEKNPITDAGVKYLSTLENLEVLNLYETKVSSASIKTLSKLKNLKKVYIWGSGIKKEDLSDESEEMLAKIVFN